jgi:hypothetical protein
MASGLWNGDAAVPQWSMLWQLRGARTDKEIDRVRRGILSVATLSAGPTMTGPRSRTQVEDPGRGPSRTVGYSPGLYSRAARSVTHSVCVCANCRVRYPTRVRVVRIFSSLAPAGVAAPTRSPWARRVARYPLARRDPAWALRRAPSAASAARDRVRRETRRLHRTLVDPCSDPTDPRVPCRLALRLGTAPALPVRA